LAIAFEGFRVLLGQLHQVIKFLVEFGCHSLEPGALMMLFTPSVLKIQSSKLAWVMCIGKFISIGYKQEIREV
jgi:hypothetical protein